MIGGDSRLDLPPLPMAATLARNFVRECSTDLGSSDVVDALVLCASELVTNALDHALPPYRLTVTRGPGRVRIGVADASVRLPVLRAASTVSERGRGIFILEAMAARWGVDPTPMGKTVWAEFLTP